MVVRLNCTDFPELRPEPWKSHVPAEIDQTGRSDALEDNIDIILSNFACKYVVLHLLSYCFSLFCSCVDSEIFVIDLRGSSVVEMFD